MAYTDPNIGITGDWTGGTQNWGTANNRNLEILRVLAMKAVIDVSADEATPVDGDLHIVAAVPTPAGAFDGHANELAYYRTNAWIFVTPAVGMIMYNLDTTSDLRYLAGAWA